MKSLLNSVSLWFGLFMVIVVIAGAIAFALTDFMSDRLFGMQRNIFIIILLFYGVYRGFRVYRLFRDSGEV
ncbi:MAG TPA: hypothetical protein PL029_01070 [Bacteroidia bacterium]|nr:hypothetical protein [Bacteroidia bacterium]